MTSRGSPLSRADAVRASVLGGAGFDVAAGLDALLVLLIRGAGGIAATTAVGCGLLLAIRRLTSAIDGEPSAAAVLAVVAAGIALVGLADLARGQGASRAVPLGTRLGLVLALAALLLPPPRSAAVRSAAVIATVAAGIAILRRPDASVAREGGRRAPPRRRGPRRRRGLAPGRDPRSFRQRFIRYERPSGADCLSGRVTIAVPAGSKSAAGHVGFCPAFAATPDVAVSTEYDGVEAVVVAAEVLPWGVRVECRLAEPAEEPLEIPVDLRARLDPPPPGANAG